LGCFFFFGFFCCCWLVFSLKDLQRICMVLLRCDGVDDDAL
jgi:hypothetical protein